MAHINPIWPNDGDPGWGDTLNANFGTMTNQINTHDDLITALGSGASTPSATTTTQGVVQLAGDLTGTASGPVLKAVVSPATVGSAVNIPVISYDAKGRITSASTANIMATIASVTPIVFHIAAPTITVSSSARAYINRTLTGARLRVASAPVGSALSIDVQHYNGTSWATVSTLTVSDGSTTEAVATFTQAQVVGNLLRLSINSVGSTTPATGVAMDILWTA